MFVEFDGGNLHVPDPKSKMMDLKFEFKLFVFQISFRMLNAALSLFYSSLDTFLLPQ